MLLPYAIEEDVVYRKRPVLVYAFCIIYLAAHIILYHFMSVFFRENVFYEFGCVPIEFKWWTPITCTFLHGGYMHLLGNLYFFWIYGRSCEKKLGSLRFLGLYLVGAYVSVLAHVICVPDFYSDIPTIGASGAISAVLGAFLVMFPTVKIRFLVFSVISTRPLPARGPAYFVLGAWFIVQIAYSIQLVTKDSMQVAFWAHLAGFAAGAVIGTIYVLLHKTSVSQKIKEQISLLLMAWDSLRQGDKVNAQLLRDEFLEEHDPINLPDDFRTFYNLLSEMLDGKSVDSLNSLSDEMRMARKRNDLSKVIQCYYLLASSRHPKDIPSWFHREGGLAARKLGHYNLALYAFACELVSGINERTDQFLYSMSTLLIQMGHVEQAATLKKMLHDYYPNSQYAAMDAEN